jgi:phosphopantothenoylcysteine decarboxylase/phosphopantothenate--cysteine ligase
LAALPLAENPDIVHGLARAKKRRTVIGFAAETGDGELEARRKLEDKGLDLIVLNDVTAPGAGFGSDTNVVRLLDRRGADVRLPVLPKDEVASHILDWLAAQRRARRRR